MKTYYCIITIFLLFLSCSTTNNTNDFDLPQSSSEWLIPFNEIKDGGPGKDGIPSIDNPQFSNVNDINNLSDNDLVVGIINNGEIKAYPHIILDWHEVVNDNIGGEAITINYCPLTGTAFGWKSLVNGSSSTFGVSGLLYNANLILYDRKTDSNWSQMALQCVNGESINQIPNTVQVIETNWLTWKTIYPNSKVLNTNTGFSRNYGTSPYGDYASNNARFIFTPGLINNDLPNKERVYAIINNEKSRAYQFSKFVNGKTVKESFEGKEYLVVGNENLIHAFELNTNQTNLEFEFSFNGTSFFTDNEGNEWSIFGEALSGPRIGETLKPATSVVSYWFAISNFYINPSIYATP
ncbi:DUF3179 domain-containing protein [Seonamhaeicola marinus]|uniref:DUF3179 domain-containing protein n=1 Tax=Seonamhaeicola marinus TaxID=1912246 RepID=A0A5D0HUE6_9FLAO|nr:DUF3179 domain-containing protein [Seonamhaeicola marinus]TYA74521.1 DUF3179 domain-containing protein [Seonamhaeicola marinus]